MEKSITGWNTTQIDLQMDSFIQDVYSFICVYVSACSTLAPMRQVWRFDCAIMVKFPRASLVNVGPAFLQWCAILLRHPETIKDLLKSAGAYVCEFLWSLSYALSQHYASQALILRCQSWFRSISAVIDPVKAQMKASNPWSLYFLLVAWFALTACPKPSLKQAHLLHLMTFVLFPSSLLLNVTLALLFDLCKVYCLLDDTKIAQGERLYTRR